MNEYTTIGETFCREITVEKSRFIAVALRLEQPEQLNAQLKAVKKLYPAATHYCYAYWLPNGQKFADDGEPQGTAGLPILNAIKQSNLTQVLVVVVRYFGGVKLGTGGLARAYGHAATEVLNHVVRVTMRQCEICEIDIAYDQVAIAESVIKSLGKILKQTYQTLVTMQIAIPGSQMEKFKQLWRETFRALPNLKLIGQTDLAF